MATFTGFVNQALELEKVVYKNNVLEQDSTINNLLGTISDGIIAPYIRTILGLYIDAFTGFIGLENKIYMQPEAFTYEIINEDIEEEIIVWNADNDGHWLNNINISGSAGVEIDTPSTPYYFTPETSKTWTLRVLADGPAVQNTQITITWDTGQVNTISISGSRVIPFPYLNHYGAHKLEHIYQNVIFENEMFSEQRRPLTRVSRKIASCIFIFNEYQAKKFISQTRRLVNSVLGVPIYSEMMTQTIDDIQGVSNISVNEDNLNEYWNLGECKYIVIINTEHNYGEIKELLSYTNSSLILKFAPVKSFPKDVSYLFPAMLATIQERNIDSVTDKVINASLTFKEAYV